MQVGLACEQDFIAKNSPNIDHTARNVICTTCTRLCSCDVICFALTHRVYGFFLQAQQNQLCFANSSNQWPH